jgi:hypothetical protein
MSRFSGTALVTDIAGGAAIHIALQHPLWADRLRSSSPRMVGSSPSIRHEPSHGRVARWLAEKDRGPHVCQADGFVRLARTAFENVEGQ